MDIPNSIRRFILLCKRLENVQLDQEMVNELKRARAALDHLLENEDMICCPMCARVSIWSNYVQCFGCSVDEPFAVCTSCADVNWNPIGPDEWYCNGCFSDDDEDSTQSK
jgi:hypothetical protein